MTEEQIQKNIKILKDEGIKNPKAKNLARLSWVNEDYIRAHIQQAVKVEGQSMGLAIWRMEHGWTIPVV